MLFIMPFRLRRWIASKLKPSPLSNCRVWTTHPARPAPRIFNEAVAMPRNRYYLYRRTGQGKYHRVGIAMNLVDAKCWCRGVPMVPVVKL